MNSMFYGCSSLISLPDISKWNTNNVTNMSGLFEGCSSLNSLPDISIWDFKKVTNMFCLFYKLFISIIITRYIKMEYK